MCLIKLIVCLLSLIILNLQSSGQTLKWVHKSTTTSSVIGQGAYSLTAALDSRGNIYQVGYFIGSTDFDPGITQSFFSPVGESDFFVSKFDSLGNFLWARAIGGVGTDVALAIQSFDSSFVYITGYFSGTVDFDPGPGVKLLTTLNTGMFILKLDKNGNYIWAGAITSTGYNYGMSLALDANSNIYLTGMASQNTDFDPGPAIVTVDFGSVLGQTAFMLKLNS